MLRYLVAAAAVGAGYVILTKLGGGGKPPANLNDYQFMGTPDMEAGIGAEPKIGTVIPVYASDAKYAKEQFMKAQNIIKAASGGEPDFIALEALLKNFTLTASKCKATYLGLSSGTIPGLKPIGGGEKIEYAIVQVTEVLTSPTTGVSGPKPGDYVAIMA